MEAAAREQGIRSLFTEASEFARRLFERKGFAVVERQDLVVGAEPPTPWRMLEVAKHPFHQGNGETPMETAYDGRQVVGMDLHRRLVLMRMIESDTRLELSNSVSTLASLAG